MKTRHIQTWRSALLLVPLVIGLSGDAALSAAGRVPLVDAVKSSDVRAARTLIQQGADVNAVEPDGSTALHWAAYNDDAAAVEVLIGAGANVKAATKFGETPLNLASVNGNAVIIERLLKAGADPNAALPSGATPLMTAARTGKVDAIKVLAAHGASVNATEAVHQQTALMWAAHANNAAAVEALIAAGADVSAHTKVPPKSDDPEICNGMFCTKFSMGSPPPGGFSALTFAARAGSLEAVQALLKAGADPNDKVSNGMSALGLASANSRWEVAWHLIDKGADPNVAGAGWTVLHQIAKIRRTGDGPGIKPSRPMGKLDSIELTRKAVAHGAKVNARMTTNGMKDGIRNRLDRFGATAFLLAAQRIDTEMMRTLLELGANAFIPNYEGTTPLMAAAGLKIYNNGEDAGTFPGSEVEALEAVRMFVELGADVNATNNAGETALHGVSYRGALNVAQYLVDKGARLDVRTQRGWTPLTIAQGVFYTDFLKTQEKLAVLLRELMTARGVSTEGQEASIHECDDCLSDWKEHADAAYERDKRHDALYRENPRILDTWVEARVAAVQR